MMDSLNAENFVFATYSSAKSQLYENRDMLVYVRLLCHLVELLLWYVTFTRIRMH